MDDAAAVADKAKQLFWLTGLAMARLAPIFQIVPFLGGRNLSGMTRNSIAFALALFLVPWLDGPGMERPPEYFLMLALIGKEAFLGVVFGFLSSLVFHAATGVGFLIDNQRGLSMAQAADPLSGEQSSPLGSLAMQTLTMLFFAGGGLAMFFRAVIASYAFWPPLSYWPDWSGKAVENLLVGQFSLYLATVLSLAAPLLLVCFLVDLGMGLMNRFAPQLNVFFLSMPVKSGLVMALLLVYWSGVMRVMENLSLRLPFLWDALRRSLAGAA